ALTERLHADIPEHWDPEQKRCGRMNAREPLDEGRLEHLACHGLGRAVVRLLSGFGDCPLRHDGTHSALTPTSSRRPRPGISTSPSTGSSDVETSPSFWPPQKLAS